MGEGQAKRFISGDGEGQAKRIIIRGDGEGQEGVEALPGDRAVTGNPVGHMNVVALTTASPSPMVHMSFAPRLRWRIQRHHAVRELEVPITGAEAPYRVIA
ncbi:MAG: hypothetical protein EBU40_16135, partial [Proteobacteria bacterium]|nr:hypothetical protein [Pseudomonadota bacterium]